MREGGGMDASGGGAGGPEPGWWEAERVAAAPSLFAGYR